MIEIKNVFKTKIKRREIKIQKFNSVKSKMFIVASRLTFYN